ncbi:MAG TPA: HAMP domain-containing sensor histidine kinase [Nitrososphaeraceae archaeon]|nr:HAMP domain-containing sensor histidine kinase [Nitrososphaeraceae archaeon]
MVGMLSRLNIAILVIIVIVGFSSSFLSHQYSSMTANKVEELASDNVRSNARITAFDLSRIFYHTVNPVVNNLDVLSNSLVTNSENQSMNEVLLNVAQDSTMDLTEGYYLADEDGVIQSWAGLNPGNLTLLGSSDLKDEEFVRIPLETSLPYYSNVLNFQDNQPRLLISFPVFQEASRTGDGDSATPNSPAVKHSPVAVIVATINLKTVGEMLQRDLSPEVVSNVGFMDRDGVVVYAREPSLVGKNYLSEEFQSLLSGDIKRPYNAVINSSLRDMNGGVSDLVLPNTDSVVTIAYQPVLIGAEHLWTLYVSVPHSLATEVGLLIGQLSTFSTIVVITAACIAVFISFIVLSWNRRLDNAVRSRTGQLKEINKSLAETNQRLGVANKQLKIHDKMQKEFINVAAHELRTPIMPILGEAQYIERQFMASKPLVAVDDEQVESIMRNAKRLVRLASDILDVTSIESKSLRLNKEPFDLDLVIKAVLDDTRNALRAGGQSLDQVEFQYKSIGEILVYADKGRIYQVIYNLLANSVKFTDEGHIRVTVKPNHHNIVVSITDTGKGIDPDIMARLFTKFSTKSETGTGLGLFICKSIIEAHGGKIWAKNNINGNGSTFGFTLNCGVVDPAKSLADSR